jgi:hypothetical protein
MKIKLSKSQWQEIGQKTGWLKNAGYMVDKYKNFLKENPEMLKALSPKDRETIEQSEDVSEIINILEKSYNVRV